DGRVTFRYKDYADRGRERSMELDAVEFLRRFVQHVLPAGFVKVRHYGLLATRGLGERLAACRRLLLGAWGATAGATPGPGARADMPGVRERAVGAATDPGPDAGHLITVEPEGGTGHRAGPPASGAVPRRAGKRAGPAVRWPRSGKCGTRPITGSPPERGCTRGLGADNCRQGGPRRDANPIGANPPERFGSTMSLQRTWTRRPDGPRRRAGSGPGR